MAANTMLKRVGARTQPCFTPFVTGNESEVSPLSRTVALMPSSNWRTSAVYVLGQPDFTGHNLSESTALSLRQSLLTLVLHKDVCYHPSCSLYLQMTASPETNPSV